MGNMLRGGWVGAQSRFRKNGACVRVCVRVCISWDCESRRKQRQSGSFAVGSGHQQRQQEQMPAANDLPLFRSRSSLCTFCAPAVCPVPTFAPAAVAAAAAAAATMSEPFKPTWPAALYAAARPSYPTELIDEMLSAPSSSSTAAAGSSSSSSSSIPLNIVDLGAGTGICTRMLLDSCVRKQLPLSSVTALDASPSMLQQLEKDLFGSASSGSGSGSEPSQQAYVPSLKQAGKLPADTKTHCAEAKFETIDLAHLGIEGTVDLLVIAQVRGHAVAPWQIRSRQRR